jgi:AcrR family transcriptional regulator
MVHRSSKPNRQRATLDRDQLLANCLRAFVEAGTLDLSLDDLAEAVGSSKRMLIHYFGGREAIEEQAMVRLENNLRLQFRPSAFPPGTSLTRVVAALWEQTTRPESRGVLLLVMDLTRRAWGGSERAKAFYLEQQQLWIDLLLEFSPDTALVEEILLLFQGAVLAYLVTADREQGKRALNRFFRRKAKERRAGV